MELFVHRKNVAARPSPFLRLVVIEKAAAIHAARWVGRPQAASAKILIMRVKGSTPIGHTGMLRASKVLADARFRLSVSACFNG